MWSNLNVVLNALGISNLLFISQLFHSPGIPAFIVVLKPEESFCFSVTAFHRTCGSYLPQTSLTGASTAPRTFLLLPTVGEQMCGDTTQTVRGVLFLVVENKCLSLCVFDDLESPSASSSASCRGQKNPFSSSCCPLHCCRPPLHHTCKVWFQSQSSAPNKKHYRQCHWKVVLPFKAVALLPSLVLVRQEAEWSSRLFALSFCLGAERGRPLQLRSDHFGVPTVVAGPGTVWRLVPKELGDGGMATTRGKIGDAAD